MGRPQPSLTAVRVLAAVDKFRGTATAQDVAAAIGHACWDLGHDCTEVPLADGGEGTLEVLGGPNRRTRVTDPLGRPVEAEWRLSQGTAVIEMARASGLALVGGGATNDPIAASTIGTGELIDAALNDGARRIIVGVGGSATIDGGLGAIRAIRAPARLKAIDFVVACDVRAAFSDAARLFGPQKGATPAQVEFLTRRLARLADDYRRDYGVDVGSLPGAGAAGGLAGGLAALGARLVEGFDVVSEEVGLDELVEAHDLVITGEGYLDPESFDGKVVGGVHDTCARAGRPVAVICGAADDVARRGRDVTTLVERFGSTDAIERTAWCVEQIARDVVSRHAATATRTSSDASKRRD